MTETANPTKKTPRRASSRPVLWSVVRSYISAVSRGFLGTYEWHVTLDQAKRPTILLQR